MISNRWAVALVAAVVALSAGFFVFGSEVEPPAQSALDVPYRTVGGAEANLADFAGTPVVVNFWASWCPACVAEMPDFEQVHRELGDQVVFLGLNMQETDPEGAAELVNQTGVTYDLGVDPDGAIFNRFGGIAMPTTVFIGADGTVVRTHGGVLFSDDLEELIRAELLSS